MATTPQMRPEMKCCSKPKIQWVARDPETKEHVHAYRCENCLATDRPVAQAEKSLKLRKRDRKPLRPRTARIAKLVELYRGETRGFSKRQLVARAKVYLSAQRGRLVA